MNSRRTSIPSSAAVRVEQRTSLEFTSETKIAELNSTMFVEQDILQLEVTVDHAFLMDVSQCQT